MENTVKTLFLTVGKEVSLSFEGDGSYLKEVRLSVNKLAELISNQIVDRESIFKIDEISLITKSNYKTIVKVENGKQMLSGTKDSMDFTVDKEKTRASKEGKNIFTSGDFIFYVSPTERLTKEMFHNLNQKNSTSYVNEFKTSRTRSSKQTCFA